MSRKKRKVPRSLQRKSPEKIKISLNLATYVNITRNDLIVMLFLFLFISFTSPPYYPEIGFWGTYFVLLVYMFHSVAAVVIARYVWDNFLNEFFKVRHMQMYRKQKKMEKMK